MKYKIGVYGSAVNEGNEVLKKAREIGNELAKAGAIVITGACGGLPYIAAEAAASNNGEIFGFSPHKSKKLHKKEYGDQDLRIYTKLKYMLSDFGVGANSLLVSRKYRNVTSTAETDAGICIAGRWGTLNEFTNLVGFGKVVGVLIGTGGIADEIKGLTKRINKKEAGKVLFNSNPKKLVKEVISELSK